jgi:hypothetical protein
VNPCPPSSTLTDWEAFVNHTHILDEFAHKSDVTEQHQIARCVDGDKDSFDDWEIRYLETHPDFIAACELGKAAAKLWALKLCHDFPKDRFRVYYTEYDNPIIRFHKVRIDEPEWLTDEYLATATRLDLRNALIYDTQSLDIPVRGPRTVVN